MLWLRISDGVYIFFSNNKGSCLFLTLVENLINNPPMLLRCVREKRRAVINAHGRT